MIKFGSVRFFKILILTLLATCFVVPLACSIVLAIENARLKEKGGKPILLDATSRNDTASIDRGSVHLVPSYQSRHPDFVNPSSLSAGTDEQDKAGVVDSHIVYFSFDDGPSPVTYKILDALDESGVKATFFLTGRMIRARPGAAKAVADKGHAIGMHGDSHDYSAMYVSVESLLDDFYRCFLSIEAETDKKPAMLRFPGGSINPYNVVQHEAMISELLRRGFSYYDWNVDSGDLVDGATADTVANNVISGVREARVPMVVLFHDSGAEATAAALPRIVTALRAEGYSFGTLDADAIPLVFVYKK